MNELERLLIMLEQANEIYRGMSAQDKFSEGALYANNATKRMIERMIKEQEQTK